MEEQTHQHNLMSKAQLSIASIASSKPDRFAAGFHALSDPLRLQILELLRLQELCVCEL